MFLSQFCDAVVMLGADKILVGFLSKGKYHNIIYIHLYNNRYIITAFAEIKL